MITRTANSSIERSSKYLDTIFPIFFFFMAVSFYLRTYDSAQVKITILQMFGAILISLWFYKVFESGHWPFNKNQTLAIAPILALFASGVVSFSHSPLPWGSSPDFIRRIVYVGIALIAVAELTSLADFRRMTHWLILAISVSTIYGLIQWIDFNFFPAGPPTVGLDKFVWRRAFGERVFSTFGNPNFYSNFLVIMIPVMLAVYLKTKKFYLIPLICLTLINIYWTRSKGPMVGILSGTTVFCFLFVRFFVRSRKVKFAALGTSAFIVLALASFIVHKVFISTGGFTSFTFRVYTWLSTWEMIRDNPILGNGIGTFWVIYPAYRRPAIFHIEGKHNTETDHAENEHLEVWFDEGLIGEGLWIWLILTVVIGIYKALSILTANPARAGPAKNIHEIPEEAYYMLGFTSGMLGMLIHNITDVSMRFVSSGTPFWLLIGINSALVMYSPMQEEHPLLPAQRNQLLPKSVSRENFMKFFKMVAFGIVLIIAIRILRQFDWCQGRDGYANPNEALHFFVSWSAFLLCWGTALLWFSQLIFKATKIKSILTLVAGSFLLIPFWGFFVGDVNHNRAIFFSKQGVWSKSPEFDSKVLNFPREYQIMYQGRGGGTIEKKSRLGKLLNFMFPDIYWRENGIGGALDHYFQVHKQSPHFIMAHYFRGNVYNDWGSHYAGKTQNAFDRGDITQAEIFRKKTDDLWSKAMNAYADTKKLGPNYVQMHHQVGTVHQKWGDFFTALVPKAHQYGQKALADEYSQQAKKHWEEAIHSYKYYYKIDPVFDQNFYRLAQLYIQTGELDKAEQTYIDSIEAKECRKPYHTIYGGFEDKSWGFENNRYDLASPRHTHDRVINAKPEAWMYLGDFYLFVKNEPQKAEAAYKRAIEATPQDELFNAPQPAPGPDSYTSFPQHVTFLKRLANLYGRQGRNDQLVETWKRVQKIAPNDPDLIKLFGNPQPKP